MGITTLNRVDLKKLAKSIDAAKVDPKEAKKVNRVDGEWILDETQGPQFRAFSRLRRHLSPLKQIRLASWEEEGQGQALFTTVCTGSHLALPRHSPQ